MPRLFDRLSPQRNQTCLFAAKLGCEPRNSCYFSGHSNLSSTLLQNTTTIPDTISHSWFQRPRLCPLLAFCFPRGTPSGHTSFLRRCVSQACVSPLLFTSVSPYHSTAMCTASGYYSSIALLYWPSAGVILIFRRPQCSRSIEHSWP